MARQSPTQRVKAKLQRPGGPVSNNLTIVFHACRRCSNICELKLKFSAPGSSHEKLSDSTTMNYTSREAGGCKVSLTLSTSTSSTQFILSNVPQFLPQGVLPIRATWIGSAVSNRGNQFSDVGQEKIMCSAYDAYFAFFSSRPRRTNPRIVS